MLSVAAPFLAGVRAALVEVSEAEDTPRALLRDLAALEASVRRLDLAALEPVADSVVDSVAEAVGAGALVEVIVAASEEDSAAAVAVAAVALGTKDQTATARPTVLLPVLADHEVGSAAAAVGSAETVEEIVEVTVAVTVTAATDAEEAIEAPAVPTTNHSAGIDTTTATAAAETATAAGTIRGNERTRATATTTGASAGGTSLCMRRCRSKMGLSRLPPISSFYLLRRRG
jgi:hypothetical protein